MFIKKESREIITLEKEIRVVGLSLRQSGLPLTFDSLGKLWGIYGKNYRGKVSDMEEPVVEYGLSLNDAQDYVTGCSVSKIAELEPGFTSFVIPKGRYLKDLFNAESFEKLVGEEMMKRDPYGWAKENGIEIDPAFAVEVYPVAEYEPDNFGMYILMPIRE